VFEVNIAVMLVVCLIILIAMGVHIAISLGMTSALGIFLQQVQIVMHLKQFSGC
jgi:hypothetical protein